MNKMIEEYDLKGKKIWVAGHRGLVGRAIARRLGRENCVITTVDRSSVDLRRQAEVEHWLSTARPNVVLLCAATVGGIYANETYPASFLYDNLAIEANVIESARRSRVEKLILVASSCIYPRSAPIPTREGDLFSGHFEPTNQWYAVAKCAGILMCSAYRRQYGCDFNSIVAPNLYGPFDNFNSETSHVIPALISKCHKAKLENSPEIEVWGSGVVEREFMYVDDFADATIFLLKNYSSFNHINVGTGRSVAINDIVEMLCSIAEINPTITRRLDRPEGAPQRLLDTSIISSMGWRPRVALEAGLKETYRWYIEERRNLAPQRSGEQS